MHGMNKFFNIFIYNSSIRIAFLLTYFATKRINVYIHILDMGSSSPIVHVQLPRKLVCMRILF